MAVGSSVFIHGWVHIIHIFQFWSRPHKTSLSHAVHWLV
jgi:hypothetical protein